MRCSSCCSFSLRVVWRNGNANMLPFARGALGPRLDYDRRSPKPELAADLIRQAAGGGEVQRPSPIHEYRECRGPDGVLRNVKNSTFLEFQPFHEAVQFAG